MKLKLTVGAVVGFLAVLAMPAVGNAITPDDRDLGGWYIDYLKMDEIATKATGKGVKIAVIDALINPDVPELQGANIQLREGSCLDPDSWEPVNTVSTDAALAAHGTNHVAMLVGNGNGADGAGTRGIVPDAEIWFYGVGPVGNESVEVDDYWQSCVPNDPSLEKGGRSLMWDQAKAGGGTIGDSTAPIMTDPYDPLNVQSFGDGDIRHYVDSTAIAARAAIRDGADIISMSVDSGDTESWDQVMQEANEAGVPVFIGTDNPTDQLLGGLTKTYSVNGIFPVNGMTEDQTQMLGGYEYPANGASNLFAVAPGLNLLGVGDRTGWGSTLIHGTSYATPLAAGTIALGMERYPEATAFQVARSAIYSAAGSDMEGAWLESWLGFGKIDPLAMLANDPTQYLDQNPMFVTDPSSLFCLTPAEAKQGLEPTATIDERTGWFIDCSWAIAPTPQSIERAKARYDDAIPPVVFAGDGENATVPSPVTAGTVETLLPVVIVGGLTTLGIPLLVLLGILIWRKNRLKTQPVLRTTHGAVVTCNEHGHFVVAHNGHEYYLALPQTPWPAQRGAFWLSPGVPPDVVHSLLGTKALLFTGATQTDVNGTVYHETRPAGGLLKLVRDSNTYFEKQSKKRRKGSQELLERAEQPR